MGRQPVSVAGREEVAEFRNELLGRLGLQANASEQDIEAAHTELVEFLELSPKELKSWAAAQTTELDEAFALLTGPEQDLVPPAAPSFATQPSGPDGPIPTSLAAPTAPAAPSAPLVSKRRRTQLLYAVVPVLIAAIVLVVFNMGKPSDVPAMSDKTTNGAQAAPTGGPTAVPLDKVKVTALTKKVTANPKDIASLQGLGDVYFASADYKNAAIWEQKILDVDPKNQVALLALGAAKFNANDPAAAKKHWLVAAKLYPKNAEVHYDLGFLYLSQTPPDMAKMTEEWNKVIAIDPNSEIAKTVATHLKGASNPAHGATPAPTAK